MRNLRTVPGACGAELVYVCGRARTSSALFPARILNTCLTSALLGGQAVRVGERNLLGLVSSPRRISHSHARASCMLLGVSAGDVNHDVPVVGDIVVIQRFITFGV